MTFFEETCAVLDSYEIHPSNITFIGSISSGHACTWEEFEKLADFDYDGGFGAQKVATDLVIVLTLSATNMTAPRAGHTREDSSCPAKPSPLSACR